MVRVTYQDIHAELLRNFAHFGFAELDPSAPLPPTLARIRGYKKQYEITFVKHYLSHDSFKLNVARTVHELLARAYLNQSTGSCYVHLTQNRALEGEITVGVELYRMEVANDDVD